MASKPVARCFCKANINLTRCISCDCLYWNYDCDKRPTCGYCTTYGAQYCAMHKSRKLECVYCMSYMCCDCTKIYGIYNICINCAAYVNTIGLPSYHFTAEKVRNELRQTLIQVCIVVLRRSGIHDFRVTKLFVRNIMQFLHYFRPKMYISL